MEEDKGRDFFELSLNNSQFKRSIEEAIKKLEDIGKVAETEGKKIDNAFGDIRVSTDLSSFDKISKELERMNQLEERRFDTSQKLREERKKELEDRAKLREEKKKEAELIKAAAKEEKELARIERENAKEKERSIKNYLRELERAQRAKQPSSAEIAIGGLERDIASVFAIDKVKDFAMQVVKVRGEIERLEVSFKTLIGSQERATKLMDQLKAFAVETPFGLEELASASKQLLAYGFQAEEVEGIMRQLGEVSAGLGVSLQDMAYLYGTTMTQGRLYARDLLQFTTRGIPLLDELTKQFGVSADEIYKMVSEGKIGFPEVQKAIQAMTQEGGRFHGMMAEITGTVSGQIERLKDAYQLMLNDIGKSQEGLIKGTIDALATLVANYEKVGEVLMLLIAEYGAYKAAIIALQVVEKARYQMTLGQMAGLTKMQVLTELLTAKTKALNKTMLANPYVLATMAVVGLGYGIYKLATYETEAEKATKRLNEALNNSQSQIEAEKLKIEMLFVELEKAKDGTDEYEKVKSKIIGKYGQYLNGLDEETRSLKNVAGAYNAITKSIKEMYMERAKQGYLDSELSLITDKIVKERKYVSDLLKEKYGEKSSTIYEDILKYVEGGGGEIAGNLKEIIDDFDKVIGGMYSATRINSLDIAIKSLINYNKEIENAKKNANELFGSPNKKDILNLGGEETQKSVNNIKKQIAETIAEIQKLEKELKNIRLGGDLGIYKSPNEAIETLTKSLDEAKKKYKELTGESYGEVNKKVSNASLKEEENAGKLRLDLQRQLAQDAIELEKDEGNKRLLAIKEKYQKMRDELADQEAKLRKNGGGNLSNEDANLLQTRSKNIDKLEAKEYADLLDDELRAYLTFEQKREKIQQEYADKRKKMYENDGHTFRTGYSQANLDILNNDEKEKVEQLEDQLAEKSDYYNEIVKKLKELSGKRLQEFIDTSIDSIRKMLTIAQNSGNTSQDAVLNSMLRKLEASKNKINTKNEGNEANKNWQELYRTLNDCNEQFQKIGDSIGGVAGEAIKAASTLASSTISMLNSIKAVQNATKEGLEGIAEKATGVLGIIQAGLSIVSFFASLFGGGEDDSKEKLIEYYEDRVDRLTWELEHIEIAVMNERRGVSVYEQIAADFAKIKSVRELELANVVGSVILASTGFLGAIAGAIGLITSGFVTMGLEAARIQQAKDNIVELLGTTKYSMSNLLGADKYNYASEYLKKVSEEIYNLYAQIDAGSDKAEELKREIEEKGYEAVTYINELVEDIIGGTSNYIAEQLGDAFFDAFDAGEDSAEAWGNSVKDIVKDITKRMVVKEFLERPLGEIFDKYKSKWFADDGTFAGIDAVNSSMQSFAQDLNNLYYQNGSAMEQLYESINKITQTTDDTTRQASEKGIATASQDSIDELNGRITAIQGHTYSISENTKLLVSNTSAILQSVAAIEYNTDRLERMESDLGTMRNTLNDMAIKGVKIQ